VLDRIMTTPMNVTDWINLQYGASAVDNRAFGSGNRAIHNVGGQMGVLQGNGGGLMTGLPWQSVHDGQRSQHEPLHLLVVIESPRDAIVLENLCLGAYVDEQRFLAETLVGNRRRDRHAGRSVIGVRLLRDMAAGCVATWIFYDTDFGRLPR
jgi:hypothetical protein